MRGRYRGFQPLGARSSTEDQGFEGFGSNVGYMTQDWQQPSAPWRSGYSNHQVQELQQQVDQMSRLLRRHELEIMHLRPTCRFRIRPSPRCRDERNHSDIGCSEREVCDQENERTQDKFNSEANNDVDCVQDLERSTCQDGGDTGPTGPCSETGMASPNGQPMASSQVEPGARAAHSRGATKDVSTCSLERSPGQHSGDSRRRQSVASIQCHPPLQRSDRQHSHVFHPSVTSGAEGPAVVPASPGPMRSGMPSDDRCHIAQGKIGATAVGQAASQPERSSQSLLTSSSPHLRGLAPSQWHAKAKACKLRDQGCNSYSNTSILQGPAGNSLRSLMQAGTPTDLWSIMSWVSATRGWTQPRRQHDVIEFLTFLRRTLNQGIIKGNGEQRGPRSTVTDLRWWIRDPRGHSFWLLGQPRLMVTPRLVWHALFKT